MAQLSVAKLRQCGLGGYSGGLMVRVQRIIVPDTQERCWALFIADQPLIAPNQYLSYLHHLGRSPNTVRAYAHHLQAFSKFLCEENRDWTTLSLTELAKFVAWL